MSRSFEEIKARCSCILDNERILFLVEKSSSPSAAFKMIMTETNNIEEAKAGRWLAVMRRDHGSKYLNLTQNKLSHVANDTAKKGERNV